jgi:hypothetical protein
MPALCVCDLRISSSSDHTFLDRRTTFSTTQPSLPFQPLFDAVTSTAQAHTQITAQKKQFTLTLTM